jgi:hypothetical protein
MWDLDLDWDQDTDVAPTCCAEEGGEWKEVDPGRLTPAQLVERKLDCLLRPIAPADRRALPTASTAKP